MCCLKYSKNVTGLILLIKKYILTFFFLNQPLMGIYMYMYSFCKINLAGATLNCVKKNCLTMEKKLFTDTLPCQSNPCLNGGTCNKNGKSFTCTCLATYTGTLCETEGNRLIYLNYNYIPAIELLF